MPTADPVGAAIEKAGSQASAIANRYAYQIQTAERTVEAAKHENYLKDWISKQAEQFNGRTDYENFDKDIEKGITELNEYIGKIPDSTVRKAVEAAAQGTFHSYRKIGLARKAQVLTDVGRAELDKNLNFDMQDWIRSSSEVGISIVNAETGETSKDISERDVIRDQMRAKIAAAAKAGIIHAAEAEKMIQSVDAKLETAYAAELMNTNPVRLRKELQAGGLTNIDPVTRQTLIRQTEAHAKNQIVTSALIELKTTIPNIDERLKKIESPEFLQSLGEDGAAVQDALISATLREQRIQEDAYKKMATEKIGKASLAIFSGKPISPADIEGLRPEDIAIIEKIKDYQVRQDRAERRERRVEARMADQDRSDALEGEILKKILTNEPLDIKDDIYGKLGKGLSWTSANKLIGMVPKIQKDPKYKLGAEVIEKAYKTGVLTAAQRGNALIDFQEQVDREQATGKRIIEIADQIVAPKKKGAISKWLDEVWQNRGQKVQPSQTDLEYTASKHGITVDEVKRRLGI